MNRWQIATITILVLVPINVYATNPFLDTPDDKAMAAKIRGAECGDKIQQDEIPLTARVVTTRVAKMP